jgi:myosin heavy subunit
MVRRIVTSIVNYEETSLVYMGADPYAKVKMPDGTYLNIDHSGIYGINEQALSKIEEANNLMITTESMTKTNMTSNQDQAVQVDKMPASDKDQLQKFEAALAELSKVKAEALSLQLAVDAAKAEALETSQKCEQLRAEIKTFTDSLIAAQKESESLRTEVTQLKPLAAAGTEALDQLRMEAARLMQLSYNGKAPQRLLEDLSKLDTVADLSKAVEAYGGKAYAQFDAKCANCGSQNITLRSSADTPDEGTPQPTAAPSPLSRLVHGF